MQPIDVGIGKPFKHRIQYWLEEWLADHDTGRVKPQAVRKMIAEWVVASWERTKEETVHNSWKHAPFSYFPEERQYTLSTKATTTTAQMRKKEVMKTMERM